MSITVQRWSANELELAATGSDLKLTTILSNCTTFDGNMINALRRASHDGFVRTYRATFYGSQSVDLHAPNDEYALWFLAQEYTRPPESLHEVITTIREVVIPEVQA